MTVSTGAAAGGVRVHSPLALGLQFGGAALVWGASFFFMRVALDGVSWGQIALIRMLLGAATLAVIVVRMRARLPRSARVLGHFLVLGAVGSYIPYTLFAWAEQHVSSGLASIYNACTPIMTVLMVTLAFRVERITRAQLLGVLIGIVGVAVLVQPWAGADGSVAGQLACLGATVCYGFTYAYLRRFVTGTGLGMVETAFLQIGVAAVIALVLAPFLARGAMSLTPGIVLSLLTLGVLGTGLAYLWNLNVMQGLGPTVASTITYVTPVVGVALGAVVLHERLTLTELAGALLVFAGLLCAHGWVPRLAAWLRSRRPAEPAADRGDG